MNREEAVSLLRSLVSSCRSFRSAESVCMVPNHDGADTYYLRAKWVPHPSEADCLNAVKLRHHVEVCVADGYTVFRKVAESPVE